MNELSLSLCMIVKNEAENLPKCLDSVKNVVDQIVIVDTGSDDNTIAIAKSYGAEIHHFTWQNNFAKARNESIKYAKGDWILWMDADERLLPESKPKLRGVLKKEERPLAYKVQIQNLQKDQKTILMSDGHRLFTNNQSIHFSGRIHEQISPSIKQLGGKIKNSDITLYHWGYSYTGKKEQAKNNRNRALLKKMVQEEPQNAYAHYTLGQFYALNNQCNKAIKEYKVAHKLDQLPSDLTCSLLNVLAEELIKIEEYQAAQKYAQESLKITKKQVGGFYLLYKVAEQQGDLNKAINNLKIILKNSQDIKNTRKQISTDVVIEDDRILFTIGSLYHHKQELEKASSYYREALQYNPDNIDSIKKLLGLTIQIDDKEQINEALNNLTNLKKQDINFLNDIAINLIKNGYHGQAIQVYEKVLDYNQKDELALKRLAGLYAKIGNRKKAEALVGKLQNIAR